MRRRTVDGHTLEPHRPLAWPNQAHYGFQGGAFTHPIAAEQTHHLARRDIERHAVKNVALAVIGVHILDTDERRGAVAAWRQSALSRRTLSHAAHVLR